MVEGASSQLSASAAEAAAERQRLQDEVTAQAAAADARAAAMQSQLDEREGRNTALHEEQAAQQRAAQVQNPL